MLLCELIKLNAGWWDTQLTVWGRVFGKRIYEKIGRLKPKNVPSEFQLYTREKRITLNHSGMLACFLGGLDSRFVTSISRAVISFGRVSAGSMTSSM